MYRIIDTATKPFLTALFIFVFLYLFSRLFGPIPFATNSNSASDLFSVTGTADVNATAKNANFSVGVTETAATSDAAREAMTTATNKIVESLKGLGIADNKIKTTNYNINPNYDYSSGGQGRITGYTASQNLEVETTSVDLANKAIDASTGAGANVVNGVQFELTDASQKEHEMEATKEAIADAKKKAQEIAQLSGIKLGRVMNIQVNTPSQPPVMFQAREAFGGVANLDATKLQPGENTVTVSVTLFYETL